MPISASSTPSSKARQEPHSTIAISFALLSTAMIAMAVAVVCLIATTSWNTWQRRRKKNSHRQLERGRAQKWERVDGRHPTLPQGEGQSSETPNLCEHCASRCSFANGEHHSLPRDNQHIAISESWALEIEDSDMFSSTLGLPPCQHSPTRVASVHSPESALQRNRYYRRQ